METEYSRASELMYKGRRIAGMQMQPEVLPLFMNTAFSGGTLSDVQQMYNEKQYTYVRVRNPNRTALAEAVSYLEGGESSLITSSGMGAITTALLTLLKPGDHIICNSYIYGETFDVMIYIIRKYGIECDFVDMTDLDVVKAAVKPNTRMVYTEVMSNPTMTLVDIEALGKIARSIGAYYFVDNTFTTPLSIKPIEKGADIVINSLTKYINGHSDAIGGSLTASAAIIDEIHPMTALHGTAGDPFDAWIILRGLQTVELRIPKQMDNAAKLAAALEQHPHVEKVNHPSLASHPQHELAKRMFLDQGMSGMMSIIIPEDVGKINEFMKKLHFAHYAMTLGGMRTSFQHPCTSSHSHMPDDVRRKMGITPGMLRISVGVENADDLIADFTQALTVFD